MRIRSEATLWAPVTSVVLTMAVAILCVVPAAISQDTEDEATAQRIAERLFKGSWDRHALEHLIEVLRNKSTTDEARTAVSDLLKGERYGPAVDSVIGALQDDNWRVRADAAGILSDITFALRSELHENVLPPVMEIVKDELSEEVRSIIEERWRKVLNEMLDEIERKAPPALIAALKDPHVEVRARAADALGNIGSPAAARPLIETLMESDDAELQRIAAIALGGIGDKAAVPMLIRFLYDDRDDVRTAAAQGLGGIGTPAIPALIDTLKRDDWRTRSAAEHLLAEIGDHTALDGLTQTLSINNWRTRVAAIRLLGDLGYALVHDRLDRDAVPTLLENATPKLSDLTEDEAERKGAAEDRDQAIATINDIAHKVDKMVVPALLRGMDDPSPEIRAATADALGKIAVREGVPGLVLALKHETASLREAATAVRDMLENVNQASAPKLNAALDTPDPSPEVRVHVALALGSMRHPTSIPILVKALGDGDPAVREAAQRALDLFKSE